MRLRVSRLACAAGLFALTIMVAAQTAPAIDLHQNWSQQDKEKFWFTPQGSLLLPYDWFLYLEQASSSTPFRDPANMARLGYIPASKSTLNPDALPIGFVRDGDRAGKAFVGLTCAACHTSVLRIARTDVIVEGAPTLADFWLFVEDLVKALDQTATTASKFTAFANNVLGPSHTPTDEENLKKALDTTRATMRTRWLSMPPMTPYGRGRLDAFGGLFNQVVAYELGVDSNARVPDAPVSYPFLWDTPQHDKVQWNGSADNRLLGGLGSVFRNIGEDLGVFGTVDIDPQGGAPKYLSSVKVDNLKDLEKMVSRLRSPVWPEGALPTDPARVRTGANVYGMLCSECHAILKDPGDSRRKIKAQMIDVRRVGTDLTFAVNFAERFTDPDTAETGKLFKAFKISPLLLKRFDKRSSGGDIFTNAILGAYRGRTLGAPAPLSASAADDETVLQNEARRFSVALQQAASTSAYKARPLNGIWATAPYLHNGSVPTIAELLEKPGDRVKTFWIGSHDLDADNLGLSVDYVPDAFLFYTSRPGNSNEGHDYGTTLSNDHKKALIEFLKTL